ncbi:unnamed protein product [Paramecium sonneborni]|uniref:Uncharacterized protein n=1 Tax=Paramecium sonneborni TaxID=65129 RepID=A0A8S1QV29_9CILI|nr:unnamed protein product [Paramecium sonneborni]
MMNVFNKIKLIILDFLAKHNIILKQTDSITLDNQISIVTKLEYQYLTPKKQNVNQQFASISISKSEFVSSQEMFSKIEESSKNSIDENYTKSLMNMTSSELKLQFGCAVQQILNKRNKNNQLITIHPIVYAIVQSFFSNQNY